MAAEVEPDAPRLGRLRRALTRQEWLSAVSMSAVIVGLHLAGWITLLVFVAPEHLTAGDKAFGIGIGLTAYALGLRHAFDADHISAIDNTTRTLMAAGQRPMSVGFFFSLGHSTVVFALAVLLSVGVQAIIGPVQEDSSSLHHYAGLIGTSVSGLFLYLIGMINVVILVGILRVFRQMRHGAYNEAALEEQLNQRGLMNRVFGPVTRKISRPWHMYPLGVLFGLGFDTATEIALLVLAGTSAMAGLPWYAILCLPVLFAAGMSLLDTLDGSFMNFAYGWAFAQPVRKIYYNITITGLSVATALIIGTIQLLSLLVEQFGLSGGIWNWIAGIDLGSIGFIIAGMFVLIWVTALLVWRFGRVEQRWTASIDACASVLKRTEDHCDSPKSV